VIQSRSAAQHSSPITLETPSDMSVSEGNSKRLTQLPRPGARITEAEFYKTESRGHSWRPRVSPVSILANNQMAMILAFLAYSATCFRMLGFAARFNLALNKDEHAGLDITGRIVAIGCSRC